MQFRKLGNTNIEVSTIAFGGWAIVGGFTWGHQEEKDSTDALRAAYDAGINFFDTAERYGEGKSEELVAEALSDVRDRIVIASKVMVEHFAPADLRAACEESLKRLRTDYIDLYQLHWPDKTHPYETVLGTLDDLRKEGKIRAYGISNFGKWSMEQVLATPYRPVSTQLAYSPIFRAIEYDILPVCVRNNISVLPYAALAQGLLTGKFSSPDDVPPDRARTRHFAGSRPHSVHGESGAEKETFEVIARLKEIAHRVGVPLAHLSMAWLLAQPGVASIIAGGRNPTQARENAQASDIVLAPEVVREINELTDPLKKQLGPNADIWRSESRVW